MTQPVKKYFLFFITVLAGFFMSLHPLTANAQASFDVNKISVTDKLTKQLPGGDSIDVTNSWFTYMSSRFSKGKNSFSLDKFKSDYENALKRGTVLLTLYHGAYDSKPYSTPYVYFTQKRDCDFKLYKSSDALSLRSDKTDESCRFYSAYSLYEYDSFYYYDSSFSSVYLSAKNISVFMFSGNYSLDSSANGVSGRIPHSSLTSGSGPLEDWRNDCGIDLACHMSNIGIAFKGIFEFFGKITSFFIGIFDFSENNSLLQLLKWLFIPEDMKSLFNFSEITDSFQNTLKPIFDAIDLLRSLFHSFLPGTLYHGDALCHSSFDYLPPENPNSFNHLLIMNVKVFGYYFSPDVCSFERAIGGYSSMKSIRAFTGFMLFTVSLFIWYRFIVKFMEYRL